MGRREGDAEERRQAILTAAEEEFTTHGYSGASMRAISRRAAVSSALLYWFFENKARLFAAVLNRRLEQPTAMAFPPAAMDLPPAIFLRSVAHIYFETISNPEQLKLMRLVLREHEREPDLVRTLSETIVSRALGPMQEYLTHQMELGNLRPMQPEYVAQVFLGMLVAFILRRNLLQEPLSQTMDMEEYADTAVDIFLQGVLTDAGAKIDPQLVLDVLAGISSVQLTTPAHQPTKIEIAP